MTARRGPAPLFRLPFEPLARIVDVRYRGVCREGQGWQELTPATVFCEALDVHPQKFARWRAKGLTVDDADDIAVRLGMHPASIWPEWWSIPIDEDVAA
ncbi:hypothetical protein [Desertimonas flava]|uniref:hypothetical protein n=1 Tax=Desertimonas flava TaxID=2064846 RepID=UPI000E345BCD|nr:hypothetical protein [Desertimonas flava]